MSDREYEVLIVGAGPAGLSAALFLARFKRTVALFDTGRGRSTWHQINHNYLGFPGGVAARKLRELGCQQLEEYPQVTPFEHKIEAMRREDDQFVAGSQAGAWRRQRGILWTRAVGPYPDSDHR